jgi:hypothetical protein
VRLRSALKRRPSAPMVVSVVALFLSVGGVGYAAVALPANSVGTDQIRDDAVTFRKIEPDSVGRVRLADRGVTAGKIRDGNVTFRKIQPRAVGKVRANLDQLQARLASTCAAGTAVGAVDSVGKVTCNPPAPTQVAAADKSVNGVNATPQVVNSVSLPAGSSYLVFANPDASSVAGASVTCSLSVGSATQSRTVTVPMPGIESIALQLAAPAGGTASVTCSTAGTSADVTTAINAIQTTG